IENAMFEAIINYNNSNNSDDFNSTDDSDDSADSDNSNNSDDSGAIIQLITSDIDNETGNISHWCFVCEYSKDPKPKHTTDHTQARQTYSKKTKCPWRCNAGYRKTEQKVYINKFIKKHNHDLTPHHEIKFITQKCEYNARQQKRYLVNKFTDINIYSKDLYNAIQCYKTPTASKINQDATLMLEYLISKQCKDPNWKVNMYFESADTSLAYLFWQSP
ncbi:41665_t:CDS:2, partial [Gigaspora margarita]